MTDELERLLSEEKEETEQVAEVLNVRTGEYSATRKRENAQVETVEESVAAHSGADEVGVFSHQTENAGVEEQFRRENSAQNLYHLLNQVSRAVREARQPREDSRVPLVRQSTPVVDSGRDALWMDRIFQRDARRYDGGFTWQ